MLSPQLICLEEEAEDGVAVAEAGGEVEGGAAIVLASVDFGTFIEEEANFGFVADGPVEGGGFATVLGVGVCSCCEEEFYGLEVTEASGVVEGGIPGGVFFVDQRFVGGGDRSGADRGEESGKAGVNGLDGGFGLDLHAVVSTLVDPGFEEVDFVGGEGAGGRHFHAAVAGDDTFDEFALVAVAGDDDGAVVAAAHGVLAFVEAEAGLLDFVAVTGEAFLDEERPDVLFEVEFGRGGCEEGKRRSQGEQERDSHGGVLIL